MNMHHNVVVRHCGCRAATATVTAAAILFYTAATCVEEIEEVLAIPLHSLLLAALREADGLGRSMGRHICTSTGKRANISARLTFSRMVYQ